MGNNLGGRGLLCTDTAMLSLPLHQRNVDLLLKLTKEYPTDRLFHAVCTIRDQARRSVGWDDRLRNIFAVSTRIANAFKGQGINIPADLGPPGYYNNMCVRTERLIHALSSRVVPGQCSVMKHLALVFLHAPNLQRIYCS